MPPSLAGHALPSPRRGRANISEIGHSSCEIYIQSSQESQLPNPANLPDIGTHIGPISRISARLCYQTAVGFPTGIEMKHQPTHLEGPHKHQSRYQADVAQIGVPISW